MNKQQVAKLTMELSVAAIAVGSIIIGKQHYQNWNLDEIIQEKYNNIIKNKK